MFNRPWNPGHRPETLEELLLERQRTEAERASGDPWEPFVRLGRFLRTLGRPVPRPLLPLDEALPYLYPKVRTRLQFDRFVRYGARPTPASRPLAGNLVVSLVLDFRQQELDPGTEHLEAWGVDFDRLLAQARANLVVRSGDARFHAVGQGCFQSPWQDDLDGSRILLPGLLDHVPVKGDPVVLALRRDLLLVAGSGDPEGLAWALGTELQSLRQDDRAGNATPLRYHHHHWEPLELPGDHPAADLLATLAVLRRREDEAAACLAA